MNAYNAVDSFIKIATDGTVSFIDGGLNNGTAQVNFDNISFSV